jgi:hypothetical protein
MKTRLQSAFCARVHDLACMSTQRIKWPRKRRLSSEKLKTSQYGVETSDFCCFRGVTAMAFTTPKKTLDFCQ